MAAIRRALGRWVKGAGLPGPYAALDAMSHWVRGQLSEPARLLQEARALHKLSGEQAAALAEKNQVLEQQAQKLRQSQQQLAAQNELLAHNNEQLARANRLKSEFLASMSHELRTPLNAVIGFSELMVAGIAGPVNAEQREYLVDIHDSGRHLLALINDVLDVSKIEAGQMSVAREPLDLRVPAREGEEMVRSLAIKKGLTLNVLNAEEVICYGDSQRIRQVVLNLLSNAVKFTPAGGTVTLELRRGAPGRGEIVVSDTGIGIDPSDHVLIFEAFRQVEGGHARHYEGTGLGLALVKKFVGAMGGEVRVHSELGKGSTFTVSLPLQRSSDTVLVPDPPPAPRVLVAEDDGANRQLLGKILRARGLEVTLVENGQQAIDALERELPSVVVLDLMMPHKDGFSVLETLRRLPGGADIGVLVLSAREMVGEDLRRLDRAGAEVVLKGSLPADQFVSCVRRLAERPPARMS